MEPVFACRVHQQQEKSAFNIDTAFLDAVRNGTKVEVMSLITRSTDTARREGHEDDDGNSSQATEAASHRQKLLKALENKDARAVWKLIVEAKEDEVKTLERLNRVCESIADHERLKEKGLIKCLWGKLKSQVRCSGGRRCCGECHGDEKQQTEFQNEEEQEWIKILSDPLYISLKWLWRNNPKRENTASERDKPEEKESKLEDVIEAALHDSHLLEKIALYEHHYSRDEYTRRAEQYENFAADVVEGSNLNQLHEIMDIQGTGCLLQGKPKDFNLSLSLLKIAADKERKRVCIS